MISFLKRDLLININSSGMSKIEFRFFKISYKSLDSFLNFVYQMWVHFVQISMVHPIPIWSKVVLLFPSNVQNIFMISLLSLFFDKVDVIDVTSSRNFFFPFSLISLNIIVTSDDLMAIICLNYWVRRDSFITHRAFCDALAQESARHPPNLSTIGSNLYGNSNTGLGLSQVGPQLSSIQDQNNQSGDILRLGGGSGARTGQFDHLLGSSFRPPQPASAMPSSAAFFLPSEPNQQYHEEHQSSQGLLPNKSFHGLMQFSDLQSNTNNNNPPSGSHLFSLPFLSSSSTNGSMNNNSNNPNNNNSNLPSSGLLISNNFNNENGSSTGDVGSNIFAGQIMGEHSSSGVPSLYSTSVQNNHSVTHMSATALLQKAAQLGSSTSNNSNNTATLLRTFGTSSSTSSKTERPIVPASYSSIFGENENHLQDLMNSFAGGSSSIFGSGSGGLNAFGGFDANRGNLERMEEPKTSTLHQNISSVSMGGSDRLTRDFLGVGEIVRSMSGGFSQRDQQNHHHHHHHHQSLELAGSLDSESNAAPSSQSFGGGGGNFQWRKKVQTRRYVNIIISDVVKMIIMIKSKLVSFPWKLFLFSFLFLTFLSLTYCLT